MLEQNYATHRDVIKGIVKNVYRQNLKEVVNTRYNGQDFTVDDMKRVKQKIFDAALGEYTMPLEVMAIVCLEMAEFYLKEADNREAEIQDGKIEDKNYVTK